MDRREDSFRKDLYSILTLPTIVTVPRPARLRSNDRDVTDIDAVAFDKKYGTLLLFQLKWQIRSDSQCESAEVA